MGNTPLAAARLFASHYQLVLCDDPHSPLPEDDNWTKQKAARGFAGNSSFRMVGTEADRNDHWVELYISDQAPVLEEWQRVTCVHFRSLTGKAHVMSVIDQAPAISAEIPTGDYAAYFAAQNLGVDQLALGEDRKLSDAELAARRDLEWYRIFLVPGVPNHEGRLRDAPSSSASNLA
jgi:hypothetical protein